MVFGSGFVVGKGLVATNAHVVAGINSPQVVDRNGTHAATTIWFDPDLDFAVLRTSNLAGSKLPLKTTIASRGEAAGVLGYPGGGGFKAGQAAILDEFTAIGRNIYNEGRTTRDVYSVQAMVVPGNSGGPLVDAHGYVIGVIFATSTSYSNVGYALTLRQVVAELNQAQQRSGAVSTGSCAE
jgi:S1-C subfamily serine protease